MNNKIEDSILVDGQILCKNVEADMNTLNDVIVHHWDGMYKDPAQVERVNWILSKANEFDSVVEVGCATGHIIGECTAKVRAGIDNNIARLMLGKKRNTNIDFYYGNVFNLTPFYNSFDCAIVSEILEHVPYENARYAVQHCFYTAKNLIVTVPHGDNVMTNEEHLWEPTLDLLHRVFQDSGIPHEFEPIEYVGDFIMTVVKRR